MALQAAVQPPPRPAPEDLPASFEELYDTYAEAIFRTLARLGVEAMHLEDAAQEVFVTAWKKQSGFAQRSTLKTWLTGIAINVASHHRRSAGRRGIATEVSDQLPSARPGPEADLQRRQGLQLLQSVLKGLSDEQREVFVMMEMEGLSAPEASALLNVGSNTVYSRLRLARAAFNAAVSKLQGGAR